MRLHVKFDIEKICKDLLSHKLDELGVNYNLSSFGEVEIMQTLNEKEKKQLQHILNNSGMKIVNDQNMIIVEKIKALITELIRQDATSAKIVVSDYIEGKLPYSYNYLSRVFSEVTYMSLEKYVILQKIDYVKELLMEQNLSLTQIAYKLNYSSVAHLSKQFKKHTGFSPSSFKELKKKLKNNTTNQ
ncbi:helix-turn-helix domain-containing protein [Winogradskyella ursingii]|uniref:helix-turn-helix domain-containing protein n=1 Tax=Winogradskyella ursingii TaxID=2686079 RepID=UPI0015C91E3E|nr:AraC family transcriptional regulator [Winogradskyella ursingii]